MNTAGNILYYQLNFNDNYCGILTLFCILTSNNWNSTTAMYSALDDDSLGPYWFFSIYFILSIMVVLNIVVSFIMEIYSSTEEEYQPRHQKLSHMQSLSNLNYRDFDNLMAYYRSD